MKQRSMPACFLCGHEVPVSDCVGRGEACPKCGQDLHCCRNCEFYDPSVYNECRESQADRVLEKEKSNFCDFFKMGSSVVVKDDKAAQAKRKLEELFKKR